MKRHIVLVIIVLLLGLFIAFSAAADPYAGPSYSASLTCTKKKADDERPVYTSIPKASPAH